MGGSVQFIGTGAALIRFGGITVLTDPSSLCSVEGGQPGGRAAPESSQQALPHIDLVLLSHLDEEHIERLACGHGLGRDVPVAGASNAVEKLRPLGFTNLYPLETWDALEARQGSLRLRLTRMPEPAAGAMLDFAGAGGAPYRIYVSGSAMARDDIDAIPERFPGADMALLHLGDTRLLGVIGETRSAGRWKRELKLLAPEHSVPIQYRDYDAFKSAPTAFVRAVQAAGLSGRLQYLKHGQPYLFR
jgi:L-ascorbate metabolism protein UlaG (beta-lactamase superfamily)